VTVSSLDEGHGELYQTAARDRMNGWFQFVVSLSARPFTVDDYESGIWDKCCRAPGFHTSLCLPPSVLSCLGSSLFLPCPSRRPLTLGILPRFKGRLLQRQIHGMGVCNTSSDVRLPLALSFLAAPILPVVWIASPRITNYSG
jgi:hypothetical protein